MKWIWSDTDVHKLINIYSTDININELEQLFNKPYEVIRKYANKLGLKRIKNNSKNHYKKLEIINKQCNNINYKFIAFNNDINQYTNAYSEFTLICNNNHKFNTNYNKFINMKTTCYYCKNMYDKTQEYLIDINKRCIKDNFKLLNIPDKITQNTKLNFECNKNHTFAMDYTHFVLRQQNCNKCNNKSIEERIEDIQHKCLQNNYKFLGFIEKYNGYNTPFELKCKKSNHRWITYYSNFISHPGERGCPRCNESKGEKTISKYLDNLNIKYFREHKFNNCINKRKLRFDFYLPEYNLCIEYNGKQHYEDVKIFGGVNNLSYVKNNDKIKEEYCFQNNIPLIIIKYNDNILEILNSIFLNHK